MPNLSASDYTSFIKAQAASVAYRNGAIPKTVQTSAQPFATQSVLNAQLLASQAAYLVTPPQTIVSTVATTVSAASATTVTAAFASGGVVTYTTSVAHGLVAGSVVTVTGLTTFNLANQTVIASGLSTTQFRVTNALTGTADVGSTTGRISGYVYYTTAAAHNFLVGSRDLTITGLSTTAFNLSGATVALVPSTTVFAIATSVTGTAVTGATGPMILTTYPNSGTSVTRVARVQAFAGRGYVNQPKSLSTVHSSTSTTQSSGKYPQTGGLPLTAAKSDGVYAPVAHLARVDTKATGGYKSVRAPV